MAATRQLRRRREERDTPNHPLSQRTSRAPSLDGSLVMPASLSRWLKDLLRHLKRKWSSLRYHARADTRRPGFGHVLSRLHRFRDGPA